MLSVLNPSDHLILMNDNPVKWSIEDTHFQMRKLWPGKVRYASSQYHLLHTEDSSQCNMTREIREEELNNLSEVMC